MQYNNTGKAEYDIDICIDSFLKLITTDKWEFEIRIKQEKM